MIFKVKYDISKLIYLGTSVIPTFNLEKPFIILFSWFHVIFKVTRQFQGQMSQNVSLINTSKNNFLM